MERESRDLLEYLAGATASPSTPEPDDDAKSDFSFDLDRHSSVKYYKKEQPPEQQLQHQRPPLAQEYLEFSDSSYEFDEDLVYEQYYEDCEPREHQQQQHHHHHHQMDLPKPIPASPSPPSLPMHALHAAQYPHLPAAAPPPQAPLRAKSLGAERKVSRPRVLRTQSLVVHRGDRVITYFGSCKEALAPIQED